MADQPPEPVDPARYVSPEHERVRALAEVLRDQAKREESARHVDERRYRRHRFRRGALWAIWLTAAYVWIATPSWLRVEAPPVATVSEETQSLRVNVFLQTQAIEAYRLERGRLPFVLQEAGPPFRGMEYRRRDSRSYDLQGRTNRVVLRYRSEESPFEFVGTAADMLRQVRSR